MRAATLVAAVCLSAVGLCAGQAANASIRKPTNIPAQELVPALKALAQEQGFQVVFRSEVVGARRTRGAVGDLTTTEALAQLLEGTDLAYAYLDEKTVTILPVRATPASSRGMRLARAADPQPARASDAAAGPTDESGGRDSLEEVIVTSQRREESIQATALTIDAFSQDEVTRAGVQTFDGIYKLVPGVNISRVAGLPIVSIRGLFSGDASPVADPKNSVSLDGADLLKGNAIRGMFFDLQRVEVLQGPQGTLYGRNAVGGAVNLIANKPTQSYGAHGEIEVGNYDLFRTMGALNLPLSDTLAIRGAFQSTTNSGYYENGLNDIDEKSGRISLLWKPDERQQLLLMADLERQGEKGSGVSLVGFGGPSAVGAAPYIPPVWNNDFYAGSDPPYYNRNRQYGLMAEYTYDFDFAALTAQISHREQSLRTYLPTGAPPGGTRAEADDNSYTAEVRLASPSGQQITWVGGLYFLEDRSGGILQVLGDARNLATNAITFHNPFQRALSYAAFGQATYTPSFSDKLHLTGGLRLTYDEKRARYGTQFANAPFTLLAGEASWSQPAYKATIQYDFAPQSMVYGGVTTGYRAGGFYLGPTAKYDPETITSYELGTKNMFFGNRLQVNLEGFYYDTRDFQTIVSLITPFGLVVTAANAGTADFYGGSLDVVALITGNDRLSAKLSATHAEYGSYDLSATYGPAYNYSNSKVPQVSPYTAVLSYDHYWKAWGGNFDLQLAAQYQDRTLMNAYNLNQPNTFLLHQEAYVRGDVSLRYAPADERWSVTAYVHNVGDDVSYQTLTYNRSPPSQLGQIYATLMAPRTYGLTFTMDVR